MNEPGAIIEVEVDGVLVERGCIDAEGKWHDLMELLQAIRVEPFDWDDDHPPTLIPYAK